MIRYCDNRRRKHLQLCNGRLSIAEGHGPSFRMRFFYTLRGDFCGYGKGVFSNSLRDLESDRLEVRL